MADGALLPFVGGALALLCLAGALAGGRKKRLLDDTPTSKAQGVFIGTVELKGTAETETPLVSHLANLPCVGFEWTVEERWSRTRAETYRDAKGNTRTRVKRESGWRAVDGGAAWPPFYLKDDTGAVRVLPEGAKREAASFFDRTCGRGDPLYYAKGPAAAIADSDHRRRFVERGIALHAPLYVIGQARERQDIVAPEIAASPDAPIFLISVRSEESVSSGYGLAYGAFVALGFLYAVGGGLAPAFLNGGRASPASPVLAGGLFAFFWAGGHVLMVFNSLVHLRQRVRQAWSLVDIQLKRRHDLITNLVAAVQGMARHEREVHGLLAALREQQAATPPGEPGPDYHGCAARVRAVVEAYPGLAADAHFLHLQRNLTDTEQRIALARAYYNDIASFFNTRLERVPDRYIAALASMRPAFLIAARDFERAAPRVAFADMACSPEKGRSNEAEARPER